MPEEIKYRFATQSDVPLLAKMSQKLIRIRTDVLVGNKIGIDFWKAVGFQEYCITMEMENQ
jgi:hypothetical protein